MLKFLRNLALLGTTLFPVLAGAQTVSVTADLKSMFGANQGTKAQMCVSLVDGSGNQIANPRVLGTGVVVPTATQCISPDANGHIATSLYANDQINPSGSIYSITYTFNGRVMHGDIYQFLLADGTENLNTKVGLGTPPVVPAPTGDTTYARLDTANQPFTGTVQSPTFLATTNVQSPLFTATGDFLASATSALKWGSIGLGTPDLFLGRDAISVLKVGSTSGASDGVIKLAEVNFPVSGLITNNGINFSNDTFITRQFGAPGTVQIGTGATNASGILAANQFVGGSGGGTSQSAFLAQNAGTVAGYAWNATANAVDNRLWDFIVNGTHLQGRLVNDARTIGTPWIDITRSGTTPTLVDFSAATATRVGNGTFPTAGLQLGASNNGLWASAGAGVFVNSSGTDTIAFTGASARVGGSGVFSWTPSGGATSASADTGISRFSPGIIVVGNGTAGNGSGQVIAAIYNVGANPPDAAFSRTSAGVIAVGNGTQGDTSGNILANSATLGLALAAGSVPAASGTIRIPNTGSINVRNSANTLDFTALQAQNTNTLLIGYNGEIQTNGGVTIGSGVTQVNTTGNVPVVGFRIRPRTLASSSGAAAPITITPDTDSWDVNAYSLTGTGGTMTINAPSPSTPTDGQKHILRIKSTNAMTYAFNAIFRFSATVTAPTTLAAGKTDYIGLMWNATDSKWDVVAVDQGH